MPGPKLFWISKSDRVEPVSGEGEAFSLYPGPSLARHLQKSLRADIGDQFVFCRPESGETFLGEIRSRNPLSLNLTRSPDLGDFRKSQLSTEIRLAFSPLKGDAFTDVLGMCVMAGLDGILPVLAERTVADWEGSSRWERKLERFMHVVQEKSQLCGRCDPLEIDPPVPLEVFFERSRTSVVFWFDEDSESSIPFGDFASGPHRFLSRTGEETTLWGVVGPEGGWSEKERRMAENMGQSGNVLRISLGPRTLSAEGAALAAASLLGFVLKPLFMGLPSSKKPRSR